ncbi:MAG: hypothetical protein COV46_06705 [Deltaproteobacteria bacterium CG11_big_fil_rev_8_21_14_0_20_49_13]|nr:MAG: hypothetical protein COV46_06705 [Deltaproteobacteria bacterium CG11_big_fil_rev_8_21_14_0_20_49_13]
MPKDRQIDIPAFGKVHCISRMETLFIAKEVLQEREYLKHGIKLRRGDTVFDIGANIGIFTLLAHRECGEKAKIFSFEPIPAIFKVLSKNANRYCKSGVKLFNMGMTSKDGPKRAAFEFFTELPGNSRRCSYSSENKRRRGGFGPFLDRSVKVKCDMTTVSNVIKEHSIAKIDLLKIDVEGAEMEVLRGIDNGHWPLIRQISMELHGPRRAVGAIAKRLRLKGFLISVERAELLRKIGIDNHMLYAKRVRD